MYNLFIMPLWEDIRTWPFRFGFVSLIFPSDLFWWDFEIWFRRLGILLFMTSMELLFLWDAADPLEYRVLVNTDDGIDEVIRFELPLIFTLFFPFVSDPFAFLEMTTLLAILFCSLSYKWSQQLILNRFYYISTIEYICRQVIKRWFVPYTLVRAI